tara:strand:+ start:314 stop:709 length:396 start_codon:yes stop_codon:yes gene_type:complete
MEETKYAVLLRSLKACEKNYHSHVREFGKLDKTDIAFWSEQLSDLSAERIERSFADHIKTNSFFPTIKDIREGTPENPRRKPCEDPHYHKRLELERNLLPEPEHKKVPMPDKMKDIFHRLQKDVKERNANP